MGWQERDWARYTDEERARVYGGSVRRGDQGDGRHFLHDSQLSLFDSSVRVGSAAWLLVVLAVALFGLLVLPHVEIFGRHYSLFLL